VNRIGAFATFNYPSNDIGLRLSSDATFAKVTVFNLKPVVATRSAIRRLLPTARRLTSSFRSIHFPIQMAAWLHNVYVNTVGRGSKHSWWVKGLPKL
jgi:uncharacterized membrane protein